LVSHEQRQGPSVGIDGGGSEVETVVVPAEFEALGATGGEATGVDEPPQAATRGETSARERAKRR
jgi:hypothetical protein